MITNDPSTPLRYARDFGSGHFDAAEMVGGDQILRKVRSGFRLRTPARLAASLTSAKRLNLSGNKTSFVPSLRE
jgi:hypothetical protein